MKSLEERLTDVQRAIEAITLRGEEFTIETRGMKRSLKRADLKELRKEEKSLLLAIKRTKSRPIRYGAPL